LAISLPASHCEIEENRPFAANPLLSGARDCSLAVDPRPLPDRQPDPWPVLRGLGEYLTCLVEIVAGIQPPIGLKNPVDKSNIQVCRRKNARYAERRWVE